MFVVMASRKNPELQMMSLMRGLPFFGIFSTEEKAKEVIASIVQDDVDRSMTDQLRDALRDRIEKRKKYRDFDAEFTTAKRPLREIRDERDAWAKETLKKEMETAFETVKLTAKQYQDMSQHTIGFDSFEIVQVEIDTIKDEILETIPFHGAFFNGNKG